MWVSRAASTLAQPAIRSSSPCRAGVARAAERRNRPSSQHGVPGTEIGDYPWRRAKKSRRSAIAKEAIKIATQSRPWAIKAGRREYAGTAPAPLTRRAPWRAPHSAPPLCCGTAVCCRSRRAAAASPVAAPSFAGPWHPCSYASAMSAGDVFAGAPPIIGTAAQPGARRLAGIRKRDPCMCPLPSTISQQDVARELSPQALSNVSLLLGCRRL